MSEGYFILKSGEDGTRIDGPLTEQEVLKRITPDKDGYTYYGDDLDFLNAVPSSDKGCWDVDPSCLLIIKGKIVIPKAVTKVMEYEL